MKIIIVVLTFVSLTGCLEQPPVRTGKEGKPLPAFTLLLQDSSTYFNTSNIPNDKPIILFYYSPRCPYCRSQMQEMISNIKILKDTRLLVITGWPFSEMKAFVESYKLQNYSNIIAGADIKSFFEPYFSFSGVPFTAVYGKDRRLKEVFLGVKSSRQIMKASEN